MVSETDTTVTIDCTANVTQGSPALTAIHKYLYIKNFNKTPMAVVVDERETVRICDFI